MEQRKELKYFYIGDSYGGNQQWFKSFMMRLGGCGAQTACDACIYFAKNFGMKKLCPFADENLSREQYVAFSEVMRPYLRPRMGGINTLSVFIAGFERYIKDRRGTITMRALAGEQPYAETSETIKLQIDKGFPIPCLILKHVDPDMSDFVWHWFMLAGYDESGHRTLRVKTVTYGRYKWVALAKLWDTGCEPKGGLVLFDVA